MVQVIVALNSLAAHVPSAEIDGEDTGAAARVVTMICNCQYVRSGFAPSRLGLRSSTRAGSRNPIRLRLQHPCFELLYLRIQGRRLECPNQGLAGLRRIDHGVNPEPGGGIARV